LNSQYPYDAEPDPTGEPVAYLPSWENWQDIGVVRAAFKTIGEVLFRPSETFSRAPRLYQGIGNALGFLIVVGSFFKIVSVIIGQFLNLMMQPLYEEWMRRWLEFLGANEDVLLQNPWQSLEGPMMLVSIGFMVVIIPIVLALFTFIQSGVIHFFLLLFGGARYGMESTFRVVAYANAAASVLSLVPLCGGIIEFFWSIVLYIIGLAEIHQTATWKAVAAVMLPLLLFFFCCCGIPVFFFMMAAMGSM
jgi:hypothetical protein